MSRSTAANGPPPPPKRSTPRPPNTHHPPRSKLAPNAKTHVRWSVRYRGAPAAAHTPSLTPNAPAAPDTPTGGSTPPVSGYPAGRTASTAYTDGTTVAAADGG